jgi:endogenous inhibitor of DNA gyrase (YacG/DUF329 family)
MNVYRSAEKLTQAICPTCGITHKKWEFWTGRGTLRRFCPACQQSAERDQVQDVVEYACNIPRR